MLKKVALSVFLLVTAAIVAILAIAGTRPATYRVERSMVTSASPEVVYAVLDDLHRFPEWSPWQKIDPAVKVDFEGPLTGVGSKYHWAGNKDVGEGRMTITGSEPGSHVAIKLEFMAPFASVSDVRYSIAQAAEGCSVTWSMDGTNNYMAKVMSLFVSMDSMIGKDFESGLANLKALVETQPAAGAATDSTTTVPDSTAAAKP